MELKNTVSEYEFTSLKRNRNTDKNPCEFSTQCLPALGDYNKSIKDSVSDHAPMCVLLPSLFSTLTLVEFTGTYSADYSTSICSKNRNYYKRLYINSPAKSFIVSTSMYKNSVGGSDILSLSFTNPLQPMPSTANLTLNMDYPSDRPSVFVPENVTVPVGSYAYNETQNLFAEVIDYNSDINHAILKGPLPTWNNSDVISFRRKLPFLDNITVVNIAGNDVIVTVPLNNVDTTRQYFLRSHATGNVSPVKKIAPGIITVSPNIFTIGEKVELLLVTSDNYKPMMFYGSYSLHGECDVYNISVISCSVPNAALKNGGYFIDYPHIYVELVDLDRNGSSMYCSNYMTKFSFKCTPLQRYIKPVHDTHITYTGRDGDRTMLFKPGGNYRVSIRIPDRDNTVAGFIQEDKSSPFEPNPTLQVFVLFSIRKTC